MASKGLLAIYVHQNRGSIKRILGRITNQRYFDCPNEWLDLMTVMQQGVISLVAF